jgi:hypothetical protein
MWPRFRTAEFVLNPGPFAQYPPRRVGHQFGEGDRFGLDRDMAMAMLSPRRAAEFLDTYLAQLPASDR